MGVRGRDDVGGRREGVGGNEHLVTRGVSCNVASFVGPETVRVHEIGYEDRPPTSAELARMQALVRTAMREGALGVASSLIYAPGFYAKTAELIALCKVAAEYDGLYISHLRSEGNQFVEALDELLTIAREAKIRAEVYHLKAAGQANWPKLDTVIRKIEAARASGAGAMLIIRKHVLGNVLGPIFVYAMSLIAVSMILASGLSFLGLGIRPPFPSWGSMLSEARDQIRTVPWLSVFPGLAIFFTVLGLNLLGDGLRDILDPQSTTRRA